MATKGGKKSTKKVKTLGAKSVSGDKAKRVRGGLNFARLGPQAKLVDARMNKTTLK
jgi:hypothetical protein